MAAIDTQKQKWLEAIREAAFSMDVVLEKLDRLANFYSDNAMAVGGENVLIQADIDAITGFSGIPLADVVAAGVTVPEAFRAWYVTGFRQDIMAKLKDRP